MNQMQYPTYFPVTDCVNAKTPIKQSHPTETAAKPSIRKKLSKLQQITAMSVAVPFANHDDKIPHQHQLMEKSSSIEVSMDRCNFECSTNNKSKVSGPLRESELLDFNRHLQKSANEGEYAEFMQSQEKRLSKNSGMDSDRHHNNMHSQWQNTDLNGISEASEEASPQYVVVRQEESDQEGVQEEPVPMQSAPKPMALATSYKEVRDQIKWNKVNNGHSVY
jgi:hypothetical protein